MRDYMQTPAIHRNEEDDLMNGMLNELAGFAIEETCRDEGTFVDLDSNVLVQTSVSSSVRIDREKKNDFMNELSLLTVEEEMQCGENMDELYAIARIPNYSTSNDVENRSIDRQQS